MGQRIMREKRRTSGQREVFSVLSDESYTHSGVLFLQTRRLSEPIEFLFNLKRLLVDLLEEFFPIFKLVIVFHPSSFLMVWFGVLGPGGQTSLGSTVSWGMANTLLACCSQIEWEFVEVYIARNGAYFRSESSNLVSQHAWCWNLDGVVPVVVVVAKGVGEVKDGHL